MKQLNKPRKRKGYIRVALLVFFVIISVKFIVGVKSNAVQTVMVQYGEAKIEEKVTGIVVRNEKVVKAPISGYISFIAKENVKIPVDSKLVEVRRERIDGDVLKRYNEVVKEINAIESSDIQTQPDICQRLNNISRFIAIGNLSGVYNQKERLIKDLNSKKTSQGNRDIDKLMEERKNLEKIIGDGIKSEYAAFTGIPVYSLDGYEEVLNADYLLEIDISLITPGEISRINLDKKVKTGQPILKLVDNLNWYLVARLNSDFANGLDKGDKVTLDFDGENYYGVRASIEDMKQEEKDCIIAFEVKDYVPGFLEKRVTEVNVVKTKFSGYVIPVNALLTRNDKTGVMVQQEGKAVFKEVVVKGDNGEIAVIDTRDNRSRLKLYDNVIINSDVEGGRADGD